MDLPVMPPVKPMLAKSVQDDPDPGMQYEPKWDGFRAIVFRDGDEVVLGSRNGKPLTRYFPELVEALARQPAGALRGRRRDRHRARAAASTSTRCSERIHPADTRVRMLAEQTPALVRRLRPARPRRRDLAARRPVRRAAGRARGGARRAQRPPVHLTPATADLARRRSGSSEFEGAGLDGVVAKPLDRPVPARQARDVQDQARADGRLRGGRLPLAQERRRSSARCCSASTTTTGALQHVGVVRVLPDGAPGRAGRGAGAAAGGPRRGIRGRPGPRRRRTRAARLPGAVSRWTRQEGPVLGAAAARAGRRGGVRPHGGRPLPAHRPVPPLAARPRPRVLHLRAAGGAGRFDLSEILSSAAELQRADVAGFGARYSTARSPADSAVWCSKTRFVSVRATAGFAERFFSTN